MNQNEVMDYPYGVFLKLRPEFMLLCGNELEAKLMRIVENWMEHEKQKWVQAVLAAVEAKQDPPPEPEEYWVTMSHSQFIVQMYYFDSALMKQVPEEDRKENTISKSSVRRGLDALIYTKKFLLIRPNPTPGEEFNAPQYTINRPYVQALMKDLPKNHLAYLGGLSNLRTPPVSNLRTPPVSNLEGGSSQIGKSPLSNLRTGELANCYPLIESVIDEENRQQKERENHEPQTDTSLPVSASLSPSVQSSFSSSLDEKEEDPDDTIEVGVPTPAQLAARRLEQEALRIASSTTHPSQAEEEKGGAQSRERGEGEGEGEGKREGKSERERGCSRPGYTKPKQPFTEWYSQRIFTTIELVMRELGMVPLEIGDYTTDLVEEAKKCIFFADRTPVQDEQITATTRWMKQLPYWVKRADLGVFNVLHNFGVEYGKMNQAIAQGKFDPRKPVSTSNETKDPYTERSLDRSYNKGRLEQMRQKVAAEQEKQEKQEEREKGALLSGTYS